MKSTEKETAGLSPDNVVRPLLGPKSAVDGENVH